jgi:hypothetical protein
MHDPIYTRQDRHLPLLRMNDTTTTAVRQAVLPTAEITSLPTAMTAAACMGIAWYLCGELNVRLLLRCTRRSLYFWSCLLCSWAIIIHLLFILLLDFKIWESFAAIVLINLTWWAYVVLQSVVLYSRLNLVLHIKRIGDYVLYMIIFTAIVFGFTTVVFSSVAVSTYTSLSHLRSRFNC